MSRAAVVCRKALDENGQGQAQVVGRICWRLPLCIAIIDKIPFPTFKPFLPLFTLLQFRDFNFDSFDCTAANYERIYGHKIHQIGMA